MKHALITPERLGLSTDLYELTMAAAYFDAGLSDRQATFDLNIRNLPPERSYLMAAGLEQVLAYLRDFRFGPEALDYLAGIGYFRREFIDYLGSLRFSGTVDAIPEGTVFFPPAPLLRISAPIIESQIIETYLLTTITYQTMIASKASRIVDAARGRRVVDFSPRRGHGPQAGLLCARAAVIGGCSGSSNVLANERFGIEISGTMAHSFVMFHGDEEEAFRAFSLSYRGDPTLLIDTYDTVKGARAAIRVATWLRQQGRRLAAVRIDSGNLAESARTVRQILDEAGLTKVRIFASGNLDEHKIDALARASVPLDAFGVGTELGTSGDSPSLDSTYKLVSHTNTDGTETPVIKLSTGKSTLPGHKQVWRQQDTNGCMVGDTIALSDEHLKGQPLLVRVLEGGEPVGSIPSLSEIRQHGRDQIARLSPSIRRLGDPEIYPITTSDELRTLANSLSNR